MREQTAVYFPAMKNRGRNGVQSDNGVHQTIEIAHKICISLMKWNPALRTTD